MAYVVRVLRQVKTYGYDAIDEISSDNYWARSYDYVRYCHSNANVVLEQRIYVDAFHAPGTYLETPGGEYHHHAIMRVQELADQQQTIPCLHPTSAGEK
jgi:hypothetical protein